MEDALGIILLTGVLLLGVQIALVMSIFNISRQTTRTADLLQEWLDLEHPEIDDDSSAKGGIEQ